MSTGLCYLRLVKASRGKEEDWVVGLLECQDSTNVRVEGREDNMAVASVLKDGFQRFVDKRVELSRSHLMRTL
jgi:hypothetical protein